jgi:polar amino acid transport system substrate-binding protein
MHVRQLFRVRRTETIPSYDSNFRRGPDFGKTKMPAMAGLVGFRALLCATIAVVWALSGRPSPAESFRLITDGYWGSFKDIGDDKAPGADLETVKQVFAAMGQDVSFEEFPPRRAWMMIARSERDGMIAVLRTSQRERICSFPDEPLHDDRTVFFVRTADRGKLKFSSFDDLVGHDVAINEPIPPSSSEHPYLPTELWKFLREHHNMIETNGAAESLRMLAAGRVDYAIVSLRLAKRLIATNGLSGKIEPLLSRSVTEEGVYVCFSKARVSPSLVDAFSRALKQFKQTEAFQEILRKYSQ